METKYSERLREILSLIVDQAPESKILAKAKQLKIDISTSWMELQEGISILDGVVKAFTTSKDWQRGFWFPSPPPIVAVQPPRFIGQGTGTSRPAFLVARPERILEVAHGAAKEGKVTTKIIVNQLRAEGDQRPERSLAVSVGNVLTRHGWQRVEPGKYKLVEKQEGKEAK